MSKTATKIAFGLVVSLTSTLIFAENNHSHHTHAEQAKNENATLFNSKSSMKEAIKRFEENGLIPQLDYTDKMGGIDVNSDGVRDDIEDILIKERVGEEQKKALLQYAKYRGAMVHVGHLSSNEINNLAYNLEKTDKCLATKLSTSEIAHYKNKIGLYYANTDSRAELFEAAEKKLAESPKQSNESITTKLETGCDWEEDLLKKKKRKM